MSTMTQQSPGFPAATVVSDSRAPVSLPSGATTFLGAGTPPGLKYGSSSGSAYLLLRPKADTATTPSTTTYTFDAPTPDTGWAFVLGDVDADAVRVRATDADGAAVPATEVDSWFAGSFNYAGGADSDDVGSAFFQPIASSSSSAPPRPAAVATKRKLDEVEPEARTLLSEEARKVASFDFKAGEWQTVAERVRLNDAGQANGEMQLFVDGESVINVSGLVLRDQDAGRIYGMQVQTFFGGACLSYHRLLNKQRLTLLLLIGSDSSWASPSNQQSYFSDFSVAITEKL